MQDQTALYWPYLLRLAGAFEVFRIGAGFAQSDIEGPVWMIPTLFAGIALCALAIGLWQGFVDKSWSPDISPPAIISSYMIAGLLIAFALVEALNPNGIASLLHILALGGLAYASSLHAYRMQKMFFGS